MATQSEIERLAVVETRLKDVLSNIDKMDKKLDHYINNFANKADVEVAVH